MVRHIEPSGPQPLNEVRVACSSRQLGQRPERLDKTLVMGCGHKPVLSGADDSVRDLIEACTDRDEANDLLPLASSR